MGAFFTPRITIVTRETRLKGLLKRWSTKGMMGYNFKQNRVAAAVQSGDMAAAEAAQEAEVDSLLMEIESEDETYQGSVAHLNRELDFGIPVHVIDRAYVPTYDFGLCAAVVVVGQDGLVANTAKYVRHVPIVAVNPDPARFDGILLPFQVHEARGAVSRVLNRQAKTRSVTLAEVTLQDGQRMLAFNDLFIGVKSHVSARYQIRIDGREEQQSSSGVLVSTGAGSSGWMSSVFNMAIGVAQSLGVANPASLRRPLNWEDPQLLWAVREPFVSRTSGASMIAGLLEEGSVIELESKTSTDGVIFSDGIESDFLEFNSGTLARIGVAAQRANLVVR